jgi:hypothetical protein
VGVIPSRWGPAEDPIQGTVVVVTTFGEDTSWLTRQPFPFVTMVKLQPEGTPNNVPFNKGKEADGYLAFIIRNYDDLPPRMVFCHNHNTGWHIEGVRLPAAVAFRVLAPR